MHDGSQLAAQARADVYRFASAVFLHPPSPALLRGVADGELLGALARSIGVGIPAAVRRLGAARFGDDDHARLRQEYMDLFAVPGGRYLMPFEDVYRGAAPGREGSRGPLLGPCAAAVKRLYRAAGARMDEECRELPTHVGVELAFMAFLCAGEASAAPASGQSAAGDPPPAATPLRERLRAFQRHFLREHLGRWFPALNARIPEVARGPLYVALGELTEAVIGADLDCLGTDEPGPVSPRASRERSA